MLRIRPEQMAALERHAQAQMIKRLAKKLKGRCLVQAASGSFEELVRESAERAEGYGIEEEADLERFLLYSLGDDSTFDADEWDPEVQEILNDPDMEGDDKLDELDDYYTDREGNFS